MNVWETIYKNYQNGGPAWASLKDSLHPDFLKFVEQADFELKNALDIGCGDGRYLMYLKQKGFYITGLDSSPTAISMAQKEAEEAGNFITADMYDHPYKTDCYDLIISHAALHHGYKGRVISLVKKIHSLLVKNGKIFISLPSDECLRTWPTMAGHETLPDGTCIPTRGPEKGLEHSFFSAEEVQDLFRSQYSDLVLKQDERGRWIITGRKK